MYNDLKLDFLIAGGYLKTLQQATKKFVYLISYVLY